MATLLWVLWHLAAPMDWAYDRVVFCGLLAFDTATAVRLWIWVSQRR